MVRPMGPVLVHSQRRRWRQRPRQRESRLHAPARGPFDEARAESMSPPPSARASTPWCADAGRTAGAGYSAPGDVSPSRDNGSAHEVSIEIAPSSCCPDAEPAGSSGSSSPAFAEAPASTAAVRD